MFVRRRTPRLRYCMATRSSLVFWTLVLYIETGHSYLACPLRATSLHASAQATAVCNTHVRSSVPSPDIDPVRRFPLWPWAGHNLYSFFLCPLQVRSGHHGLLCTPSFRCAGAQTGYTLLGLWGLRTDTNGLLSTACLYHQSFSSIQLSASSPPLTPGNRGTSCRTELG